LEKANINIYFIKSHHTGIKEYNFEWAGAFYTIFSQIVEELGEEFTYLRMTAGKDWEFRYMCHGKLNITCSTIDYCLYTSDTNIRLLTKHPSSDRENIRDHSALVFHEMMRFLYRILPHIYYNHRKLFDSLEYRYRIAEGLTLYCKKFNIITKPKEYCIKI
jgi:hypothetical protein